jgi:hypothetical protein
MSLPPTPDIYRTGRTNTDPTSNRVVHRRFTDAEEMALSRRQAFVAQRTQEPAIIERIKADPSGRVIALDIDECSAIGSDTYDILRIIQQMTQNFQNQAAHAHLLDIARNLINPKMIEMVNKVRMYVPHPLVVFYTQKSRVLRFFTANWEEQQRFQSAGMVDKWGEVLHFHSGNLLTEKWDYLNNQVRALLADMPERLATQLSQDRSIEMHRIGILTWAASIALGLPYAAPVFVTARGKDMDLIESLVFNEPTPLGKSFLFDDKATEHAQKLSRSLEEARMIAVAPYTHSLQSEANATELFAKLNAYFGITPERRETHAQILKSAAFPERNWPASNLVIAPGLDHWEQHAEAFTRQPQPDWDASRVLQGISTRRRLRPEEGDEAWVDPDLATVTHMPPSVRSLTEAYRH